MDEYIVISIYAQVQLIIMIFLDERGFGFVNQDSMLIIPSIYEYMCSLH